MSELINSSPDFGGAFGDKRLEKRADQVLSSLIIGKSSSVRQISRDHAEQKSFYRLLNNDNFSEESIKKSIVTRCSELCTDRDVLCIQDTTEFNLSAQQGRLKPESGLGKTTKKDILGFMLHSSLVIDAYMHTVLVYSYIKAWERKEASLDRHQRGYKDLPIEEKESYKWLEAASQSKELLGSARSVTVVADRESDIYDLLSLKDEKLHLLIRSNADRQLVQGGKLSTYLGELPCMHQYELPIAGDIRTDTPRRLATMGLKWAQVQVRKPSSCKNKNLPKTLDLYVVETQEVKAGKGIYWRLLTTHPVNSIGEALQIVSWYKLRWNIEQIHRLLKTDGFRIERSQLEQGWAIRKLTLLAMMGALRILQMTFAYQSEQEQDIGEVFEQSEQECLVELNTTMEGQTQKLKNPHKPSTLKWATWIIARLGGWKGYQSERKPGPIVLQKGLAKFYGIYQGWELFKNSLINVYTQ